MVAQLVWPLLCLGLAFAIRGRPAVGGCVALGLWVVMPAGAGELLTRTDSGPFGAHPATFVALAVLGLMLLLSPADVLDAFSQHYVLFVASSVFVLAALLTSFLSAAGSIELLLDMIVGPMAIFWVMVVAAGRDPRAGSLLRSTVLGLALVEAVLALVQFTLDRVLLWQGVYEGKDWFDPDSIDRFMGTTDHPLTLALLIATATPLCVGIERALFRYAGLAVLVLGMVTTQSRSGVAVVVLTAAYVILRSRTGTVTRILGVTGALVGGAWLLSSDIVAGVTSRFGDDTGSSEARMAALEAFVDRMGSVVFTGEGLTASYRFAIQEGLASSLESSFLMYAVDVGLVMTLVYYGSQVALLLRYSPSNQVAGAWLAATWVVLLPNLSSALGFSNLAGALLWSVLALLVIGRVQPMGDQAERIGDQPPASAVRSAATSVSR